MSVYVEAKTLEHGLAWIREAPTGAGSVELVVRRPREGQRTVLDEGLLTAAEGLVGDDWSNRDGHRPDRQLTLMNARVIGLIAGPRERWPLAGDQLYVDLDLSEENLPPRTRLRIGSALVEVSDALHTGCAKFTERFGSDAIRFVNQPPGRSLRLRGMYARIVEDGAVRPGDVISKL
jgi:MOSC domain-containing protein YiiM